MRQVLVVLKSAWLISLISEHLMVGGFEVQVTDDGELGLEEAVSGKFSIVVLDGEMANRMGSELLRRTRKMSAAPVAILSDGEAHEDISASLESGLAVHIVKPCTSAELMAQLRMILRPAGGGDGRNPASPAELSSGSLRMRPRQRLAEWAGKPLALTRTEFDLLFLLLRHVGHAVSKRTLSLHALNRPLGRYDRGIDVHLSRVRKKLGRFPDGRSPIQAVGREAYQLIDMSVACGGCARFSTTCPSSMLVMHS